MATSPQERSSGNPRGLIGEIRMTLEEVKNEIMERRSQWLDELIANGSDYASGKVSAFDSCLELLSKAKVKDGKK